MIDYHEFKNALEKLPEPTLGLKGGVSRQRVVELLDKLVCQCPDNNNGEGYRHECPRHGDTGWDR